MLTEPIQQILVPTDLTEFGTAALRHARLLKKALGGEITALYVHQPLYVDFESGMPADSESVRESARKKLVRDVEDALGDVMEATHLRVEDGSPAPTIIRIADEIGADLIVMGTHGRQGWRRAVLGSVAERVLHGVTCAVLTVGPANARPAEPKIASILCPASRTAEAQEALRTASILAAKLHAQLVVAEVKSDLDSDIDTNVRARYEGWVDTAVRGATCYVQVIAGPNTTHDVLQFANASAADLIVLGAKHTRSSEPTVVGESAEQITRFARQPVLTVVSGTQPDVREQNAIAALGAQ